MTEEDPVRDGEKKVTAAQRRKVTPKRRRGATTKCTECDSCGRDSESGTAGMSHAPGPCHVITFTTVKYGPILATQNDWIMPVSLSLSPPIVASIPVHTVRQVKGQ